MDKKTCKKCGVEKPILEYTYKSKQGNKLYYDTICKVCKWEENHKNINIDEIDRIIIDNLLNKKVKAINELTNIVKEDLFNICFRICKKLKLRGNIPLLVNVKCTNCGKNIKIKCSEMITLNNHFCCKQCFNFWIKMNPPKQKILGVRKCKCCGTEFIIKGNTPNQKYCSTACKNKINSKTKVKCSNCGKEIIRTKDVVNKYKHSYCSIECLREFRRKEANRFRSRGICEICGKQFLFKPSENKRFCSVSCQNEWQRKQIGKLSSHYKRKQRTCYICGKNIEVPLYKIKSGQKQFFCSKDCFKIWFSREFSQNENYKNTCRIRAVKLLEKNRNNTESTKPQKIVNNILNQNNIKYINEYNCKYYAMDNAIIVEDKLLFIEVMGQYWHCDSRKYKMNINSMQKERIKIDKAKRTYIKNKYNIDILYLWEFDIIHNIEMCEQLIKLYIKNNGQLKYYHSFNYILENNNLIEKHKIIHPYMDFDKDDINKMISNECKLKINKKQNDKWITFTCEYCGKVVNRLKSKYNINKHHYCSIKCANLSKHIIQT